MSDLSIKDLRKMIFDSPQAQGIKKEAGLVSEVNAITGKNVDDAAKKVYDRYLSELGIFERKPALEAIKEEAVGSRLTNDAIIQREQRRHAQAVEDATEKAKLGGIIGASAVGFGAGAYGGSKLYDHLTRPQAEEEKVASEEGQRYNPNWDLLMASLLNFSGTSLGMKAAKTEEGFGRAATVLQGVGLGAAGGTPYLMDYFNAKNPDVQEEKTASIARKAVDVLTGKAKADAGQEVLKASEYLKDVGAKRDTVRGAVSDLNNDVAAARDGAKMLAHGQGKKTDLETLLEAARERKLTATSNGINNRKAGRIDYVTDSELDANDAFNSAKGKYDEYVNELYTRANKPLVDKMTPEFIASQKDDYINRLLGLDKEMGGAQETVKNLQGNYKKQRALQYGSYGALGAGAVAALPKKKDRPYVEGTQAAQTLDPMMYDMGQIDQMASEGDYFEKIAFAAGLLAAGRGALGAVGRKAGQMGVQNAIARKAGQGIAGDTVGQTLKNVGSRAGGFVGDFTGQTNKVLAENMKNSAGAFKKSTNNLNKIDGALEKQMGAKATNFDKVDKLQGFQLNELQNATNAENTMKTMHGIRGPVNLAQDKARLGTAVGGAGLLVGNRVGKSNEETEAKKLYAQQQF